MNILIATPCAYGMVRQEYSSCLLSQTFIHPDRLNNQEKYHLALYQTRGYSGLGKDRGVIASYALRHKFDKLMFIDNDMQWTWEQLKMILDSDKKVVGGIAALKQYPVKMNFVLRPEDKDLADDTATKTVTHEGFKKLRAKYKEQTEIKVGGVGTAFMCIDVSVLEKTKAFAKPFAYPDPSDLSKLVQNWDFFPSGPLDNYYFGEDWGACIQFQRAGFDIHINTEVRINHIGDHTFMIGDVIGTEELP